MGGEQIGVLGALKIFNQLVHNSTEAEKGGGEI